MKNPNRIGNAAKSLFKEVAAHLKVTPQDLFSIHQGLLSSVDPRKSFAWCCLELERTPTELRIPIPDLISTARAAQDFRFELLYELTYAFIVNSPSTFLTAPPAHPDEGQFDRLFKLVAPADIQPRTDTWAQVSNARELEEKAIEAAFGEPLKVKALGLIGRPTVTWNSQQDAAFKAIWGWLKDPRSKPVLRVFGFAGTGKAQPVSCKVHTEKGVKRLGAVKVGDYIYGSSGKLTKVLGVYPQGVKDVYKVTFKDRTSTRCCIDHLWQIEKKSGKQRDAVMTTRELIKAGLTNSAGFKFRVPLCSPVAYPKRDLPIHPYVMGVMLGNGSFRGNVLTISNHVDDKGIIERVRKLEPDLTISKGRITGNLGGKGMQFNITDPEAKSQRRLGFGNGVVDTTAYKNKFKLKIEGLGLLGLKSNDKFIPREYLLSSVEDRWELLRGLMDTDGSAKQNGTALFCSFSKKLRLGIRRLVQSLGGMATIRKTEVSIRTFENCFWLQRKANRWKLPTQNSIVRSIVAIEKVGKEEQVCIKVSAKDSLYLTDNFIVTHNTTMAKEVAWNVEAGEQGIRSGDVLFAAYTGKAAARLIAKGCAGASTIHSLIYRPKIDPITGRLISTNTLNEESPLKTARLLILDEVSMVNEEMALDLLSFGVPILCLGDPEQLPPIRGEGYFINARADHMLTAIERTVADNPIIYLATRARMGKRIHPGRYDDSRVYAPGSGGPSDKRIQVADQILVGTNRSRTTMNKRYRMLNGKYDIDTQFPVKGDRLMCLKNNKTSGLLNGTIWQCTQPEIKPIYQLKDPKNPLKGGTLTNIEGLYFKVRSEDMLDQSGKPIIRSTVCSTHHFDTNLPEPHWREIAGTDEFTFGYASTIHKFQGSEADKIVLIDESSLFRDMQSKHLYTAITRAAETIHIYQTDY